MSRILRKTNFGNPILRQVTRKLDSDEITSEKDQELISNIRHTLENKKYGIGLAAPQVG